MMQLAIQASSIVTGMAIPGIIGGYLDSRFGTQFCLLIGIGLGMVVGLIQLLALARKRAKSTDNKDRDRDAGT